VFCTRCGHPNKDDAQKCAAACKQQTQQKIEVQKALTPAAHGAAEDPWEALSEREREALGLVARGHTAAEIAALLSLSVKTVETYRARGMEKLGLRSRAQLVQFALARGLLRE